jgi:hypothetical protein
MSGPVLPPPAWHPDPTGRHELRYWDGASWTEHVSDRGQVGSDDLATPTPRAVEPEAIELGAPPPSVAMASTGMVAPGAGWGAPVAAPGAPPSMMRSIGGLAASLTVILWITVAVSAFGVFAFLNRAAVANDILDFDFSDGGFSRILDLQQRSDDADTYASVARIGILVCSLAIFVLLIVWMWRVAKNAELSGRDHPRFSPGWTIGGWFIPFANLVIPVLVMQDLWRASDPTVVRGDRDWRRGAKGSALVGVWWAAHLVAALRFATGSGSDSRSDLEGLRRADHLAAFGSVAAIAAAVLLIFVVRGVTRRQEALLGGDPSPLT